MDAFYKNLFGADFSFETYSFASAVTASRSKYGLIPVYPPLEIGGVKIYGLFSNTADIVTFHAPNAEIAHLKVFTLAECVPEYISAVNLILPPKDAEKEIQYCSTSLCYAVRHTYTAADNNTMEIPVLITDKYVGMNREEIVLALRIEKTTNIYRDMFKRIKTSFVIRPDTAVWHLMIGQRWVFTDDKLKQVMNKGLLKEYKSFVDLKAVCFTICATKDPREHEEIVEDLCRALALLTYTDDSAFSFHSGFVFQAANNDGKIKPAFRQLYRVRLEFHGNEKEFLNALGGFSKNAATLRKIISSTSSKEYDDIYSIVMKYPNISGKQRYSAAANICLYK